MHIIKRWRRWDEKKGPEMYIAFTYAGWGHSAGYRWTQSLADAHRWEEKSGAYKWIKRRPELALIGFYGSEPEGKLGVVVEQAAAVPAAAVPAIASGHKRPRSAKPRRRAPRRRPAVKRPRLSRPRRTTPRRRRAPQAPQGKKKSGVKTKRR